MTAPAEVGNLTMDDKKQLATTQRLATRAKNEDIRQNTTESRKKAIQAYQQYQDLCTRFLAKI